MTFAPEMRAVFPHVMIDIETLGTEPGSVITQIGAVAFFADDNPDAPFEMFRSSASAQSGVDLGMTMNPATIAWWMQQGDEARKSMEVGMRSGPTIDEALSAFGLWFERVAGAGTRVWGNGASFDLVLMRAAYKACGLTPTWTYRQEMCFRTIRGLAAATEAGRAVLEDKTLSEGLIAHDAKHDALLQARQLCKLVGAGVVKL